MAEEAIFFHERNERYQILRKLLGVPRLSAGIVGITEKAKLSFLLKLRA